MKLLNLLCSRNSGNLRGYNQIPNSPLNEIAEFLYLMNPRSLEDRRQGCVVVCPGRNTVLNTISILPQCDNTVLNTISILTQCENTILNTISSLLILIVFSFLVFLIVFCTDTVSILCSVS